MLLSHGQQTRRVRTREEPQVAEVLAHWPPARVRESAVFMYPWDQWMALDENGHGDIWLAAQGTDFPPEMTAQFFKDSLHGRVYRENAKRKKRAPEKMVRNPETGRMEKRLVYRTLRVKVRIVSRKAVAFQFYDSPTPPPEPPATKVAVPTRRPLHARVTVSEIRRVSA